MWQTFSYAIHHPCTQSSTVELCVCMYHAQAMKRGLMEEAHIIAASKHDGDTRVYAEAAARHAEAAVSLRNQATSWRPNVLLVSSAENHGIGALMDEVERFASTESTRIARTRAQQRTARLRAEFEQLVVERAMQMDVIRTAMATATSKVHRGEIHVRSAAEEVCDALLPALASHQHTSKE